MRERERGLGFQILSVLNRSLLGFWLAKIINLSCACSIGLQISLSFFWNLTMELQTNTQQVKRKVAEQHCVSSCVFHARD